MNLNKTTKDSTKQEATPFGNLLLPAVFSTVFEQYEFKGWLITIENYRGTDELIGFATPTKYAHLLNADNYYYRDEIAEENKIKSKINEDGDEYSKIGIEKIDKDLNKVMTLNFLKRLEKENSIADSDRLLIDNLVRERMRLEQTIDLKKGLKDK